MSLALRPLTEDVLDHFRMLTNPATRVALIYDRDNGSNGCPECSRIYRALVTLCKYSAEDPDVHD